MLPATAENVAGDFGGATLRLGEGLAGGAERAQQLAEFSHKDGRFLIRTDGPDGVLAEFEVRYAFGVQPLQQYLLSLPAGRLQASRPAWSTAEGRWFDLRPGQRIDHDDALHWTASGHNWNFMCADCHSTAVTKGYDAASRIYQTEFAEVSVGCEACHGPGSNHAKWPDLAQPASLADQQTQINACAPCHSRRGQLAEGFTPQRAYFDHYIPALLDEGLYHADGQILDEVYVYGSFLQSRMHEAGVSCGHCHEPHSAQLRTAGNDLCTACHNEAGRPDFPTLPSGRYDHPDHHLHRQGTVGSQCVSCHMSATTYMVVDDRRDHSFRVPRPDLNASTGAPDACTGCHSDRSPRWASQTLATAFLAKEDVMARGSSSDAAKDPRRRQHFGPVFAAARRGATAAEPSLAAIGADGAQPAMVRATALALMVAYDRGVSGLALEKGLQDPHPLVRIGALRGAARWHPMRRWRQANHLLGDEFLAVRTEAVPLLVPALGRLAGKPHNRLAAGIAEYLEAQTLNSDRPEAHTNIGNLHVAVAAGGRPMRLPSAGGEHGAEEHMAVGARGQAEAAFQTALELNPGWVPALVNLADLYRATGRDVQAGELLQRACELAGDSAGVLLARALWLVRQNRSDEALPLLAKAAASAPHNARYAYTYAIALHSAAQPERALDALDAALAHRPEDQQLLGAALDIAKEANLNHRALDYQRKLAR